MTDDRYGKIHTDGGRSGGQPLGDSIEAKALALVNEVLRETESTNEPYPISRDYMSALCRAIEQHEAFKQEAADRETNLINAMQSGIARAEAQHEATKQEFSDTLQEYIECFSPPSWHRIDQFIIPKPKPDPLFDVLWDLGMAKDRAGIEFMANGINDALKARGLEIQEKGE